MGSLQAESIFWYQAADTQVSHDWSHVGAGRRLCYSPEQLVGPRIRHASIILTSCIADFRHTCEQHEGMAGYGWDSYDPRIGGVQTIHDAGNNIDVVTEFVKFVDHGDNGGSWGARIRGTPREDASPDLKTTVVFYAGLEGIGTLEVQYADEGDNEELGFLDDVKIAGQTPDLGSFTLNVVDKRAEHPVHGHPSARKDPLDRTKVHSMQVPEAAIWQAKGGHIYNRQRSRC